MSGIAHCIGTIDSTGELVQQMALLHWLRKEDEESKKLLEKVTQLRLLANIWNKITSQSEIDAARAKTILAISEYVKKNPKASKADLTKFVSSEIESFAATVDSL